MAAARGDGNVEAARQYTGGVEMASVSVAKDEASTPAGGSGARGAVKHDASEQASELATVVQSASLSRTNRPLSTDTGNLVEVVNPMHGKQGSEGDAALRSRQARLGRLLDGAPPAANTAGVDADIEAREERIANNSPDLDGNVEGHTWCGGVRSGSNTCSVLLLLFALVVNLLCE
jgi:hypothetical protein